MLGSKQEAAEVAGLDKNMFKAERHDRNRTFSNKISKTGGDTDSRTVVKARILKQLKLNSQFDVSEKRYHQYSNKKLAITND